MPYVQRNEAGRITGLHLQASDGWELLPDDAAEVQAFIATLVPQGDFLRLDSEFVRVIEDLIDALIARNVINITDLPEQAQSKLFSRKAYRERSASRALKLFGDGPTSVVLDLHPLPEGDR